MTRDDAIKYFERKLRNFEKSMETADRRGDEGAVAALRRKMEIFRMALRALKAEEERE